MNEEYFGEKLHEICGAFGRPYPKEHVCDSLFKRVESLPDGFMDFALERLENQPEMPKNLGYHLRHVLWPEYLEKNPDLCAPEAQHGCRQCSADTPGFFWAYDASGKRYALKCACNGRRDFEHLEAWTHAKANDAGLSTTDPLHHDEPQSLSRTVRASIGHTERARPDHTRELSYAESGSW